MLGDVLAELRPQIRAGVPVVGLEPSCVAVFRDELVNLFPNDQDARRLSTQVFGLAEFLERAAPGFEWPRLAARGAVFHGHCHQKALWGTGPDVMLLRKLGLDLTLPDSGCCGLAGSFGYERGERYEVSVKAGERVLAPAVRAAGDDVLIVTDGFSCRSQITHLTGRRPMHLAEVMHLALTQDRMHVEGRPEDAYFASIAMPPSQRKAGRRAALAGLGVVGTGAAAAWLLARRH
jgi:Fe-S oxidoreductase